MGWWKRIFIQESGDKRELRVTTVTVHGLDQLMPVSLRPLNSEDKEAIRKLEQELADAGVLAPRGGELEITDRLEDILQAAEEQGLANVRELIGDEELDNFIASGNGGPNLMLQFDEDEDTVYGEYEDRTQGLSSLVVEAKGEDGLVALRLPDGSTVLGKIPGI